MSPVIRLSSGLKQIICHKQKHLSAFDATISNFLVRARKLILAKRCRSLPAVDWRQRTHASVGPHSRCLCRTSPPWRLINITTHNHVYGAL